MGLLLNDCTTSHTSICFVLPDFWYCFNDFNSFWFALCLKLLQFIKYYIVVNFWNVFVIVQLKDKQFFPLYADGQNNGSMMLLSFTCMVWYYRHTQNTIFTHMLMQWPLFHLYKFEDKLFVKILFNNL